MPKHVERHKTERPSDRIELLAALELQLGIVLGTIAALLERHWLGAFAGSIALLLTFAPALLQ